MPSTWVCRFNRNGLNIPERCNGCGEPLLLECLFVDDGCPCNTPRGTNFKPEPCALCESDYCVTPAHRLKDLFGIEPEDLTKRISCGGSSAGPGETVWQRIMKDPLP